MRRISKLLFLLIFSLFLTETGGSDIFSFKNHVRAAQEMSENHTARQYPPYLPVLEDDAMVNDQEFSSKDQPFKRIGEEGASVLYAFSELEAGKTTWDPAALLKLSSHMNAGDVLTSVNIIDNRLEKYDSVIKSEDTNPGLDRGAFAILGLGFLGLLAFWRRSVRE